MASSLSLSLPSSSSPRNWIHHVFPSFHGADVRTKFLSHVMKELRNKGINPFIDNDIVRGKSIGPELVEAIRGSRIAIILLSKNYASSTWCLDELVEIMKCREELGQTVMTLFYEVDPSDIKKQTGDFGEVFGKTCEGKTDDNIGRWKHALAEVAKIAGYHSNNWNNEAEMIEKISNDVSSELNISAPSNDFDVLVGMGSHMKNMGSLLQLDSAEVRMIGIWGPSGIGKTTIARFLFDRHSKDFQLSIFMENIKSTYTRPACSDDYGVKKYLQNEFLSQIIKHEGINIPHLGIIKDRLRDKKVLVVLDDVDQLVQLEAMAKETWWFGASSRIIVTTQDRKLLKTHGINHIYKVDLPSSNEAFEMFCMYAFDQKSPKDGFEELAWEVTELAGNLPLGLKVMGSYFRRMSMQEWKMELPRVKNRLDGDIESILKLSYDALYEEDQKLFLHIASGLFFPPSVGMVEACLANSVSNVTQGLHVLAEKSLISMDMGWIKMQDLLVRFGKQIVRKQSVREPGKRQFLVDARDIEKVLNDENADCSSVIGIKFSSDEYITCTSETAFERLSNLQFLDIYGSRFHMDFQLNSISRKLRMLHWPWCEMPSLPSNFHTQFLVSLRMSYSKLEKLWKGIQPLYNLKWMALSYSEKLKEVPDLSTATNLKLLDLCGCSSLVSLPQLPYSLLALDASDCTSLKRLDCSFRNPDICLNFSECRKLNQEARELIIHTRTNKYAVVLPGAKLPECFTYRAFGSSLTVKLNQNPLRTSTKFMACILLDYNKDAPERSGAGEDDYVHCSITSKQNALTACISKREIRDYIPKHLYIFEVEAEEMTSAELDFEFSLHCSLFSEVNCEIKECGVYQLRDGDEDDKRAQLKWY